MVTNLANLKISGKRLDATHLKVIFPCINEEHIMDMKMSMVKYCVLVGVWA